MKTQIETRRIYMKKKVFKEIWNGQKTPLLKNEERNTLKKEEYREEDYCIYQPLQQ